MNNYQIYEEDGYKITKRISDSVVVIRELIPIIQPQFDSGPPLSIEEENLVETRYQTMLLEMSTLGGM